jgi:rubredoxin
MRYLCDGCERLVEAGRYRVEAGALELTCPRCGEPSRVVTSELRQQAAPSFEGARPVVVPFAPRPGGVAREVVAAQPPAVVPAAERCPKCATPKRDATACARCGLVFALYQPEADVIPQSARREFARLLDEWGTPASERLLDAVGPEQLALLARLSRHHLADFPGDARAQGILDGLTGRGLVRASAAAASSRISGGGSSTVTRNLLLLVGLLTLLAMAFGLVALLRKG